MKNSKKTTSVINQVAMENKGDKHNSQHSHCIASLLCVMSEKNWSTKEDKGKSMEHVLYILWLAKRHILGQSDIEQ